MRARAGVLSLPLFPETERLGEFVARIVLTIAVAFLVQRLLFLVIGRMEAFLVRAAHDRHASDQRARTLGGILRSLTTAVVGSAALIHVLEVFGWDVKPLLAGAGILGVALGFGAQTLVRDVIAGFFILAEDQYAVGDLIEVNGRPATVESLTVRSTTLRDFNGFVHFVPNGELKIVTNRSRGWNRTAVDLVVAADEDVDAALRVCRDVTVQMNADSRWRDRLLDPIEVWGVESVNSQELQIRIVLRSRPGADLPETTRELRRRLLRGLLDAGVRTAARTTVMPIPPPPQPVAPIGGGSS